MIKIEVEDQHTTQEILDINHFYKVVESCVLIVSSEEYSHISSNSETPETIAWVEFAKSIDCSSDTKISNVSIIVNSSKFPEQISPKLRKKLIDIVIRHESAELWHILTQNSESYIRHSSDNGRAQPHNLALIEEWKLAFELGCQDAYLELITLWSSQISQEQGPKEGSLFLNENQSAKQAIEKIVAPAPI